MISEPIISDGGSYSPGDPITTPGTAPAQTPVVAPPTPAPPEATPAPPSKPPPVPLPALPRPNLPAPPAPVGVARYSEDDYTDVALAMRPRGRVWPNDPDSIQAKVFRGLAKTLVKLDAAASSILAGSLPGSALSAFVPEWEATLGLPDPCAGDSPSFAQRRDQIRARFVGTGGQSAQRFIDFAAELGFTIQIDTYAPFRAGHSSVGSPLASDAWSFVWAVQVIANPSALPVDLLRCELEAIKPANTTIELLS